MIILIKIYQYRDYANVDEEDRSNIFLISFHYLLHITESIEDFDPCKGYWQFPIERVCGMLIPLVKSQKHPYASLWNNIFLNIELKKLKETYAAIFDININEMEVILQ